VAALDTAAGPPFGPILIARAEPSAPAPTGAGDEPAPPLQPGEILLSTWAAEDLGARPGDSVEIEYFVVGDDLSLSTTRRAFTVRAVSLLSGVAGDRQLTPEFPGVTDAARVGDWDPPFPVDLKRIRPKDEEYWKEWRATPKAFIALEEGRRLW
jgi:putative ABC transport system permease protein